MSKTLEVRIKHKLDTSANWTSRNPVLLSGEIIFVDTDDGTRIKIGDGTTPYANLPFTDELLRTFVANNYVTQTALSETISSLNFGFAATEDDM